MSTVWRTAQGLCLLPSSLDDILEAGVFPSFAWRTTVATSGG